MSLYDLKVKNIKGEEISLSQYKGKTLLFVNVASRCGYTSQYEGLEKIFKEYQNKGFMIIGFPANDFGSQEPGTNDEIVSFCKMNYGVSFDLMAKSSVLGRDKNPVYQFLTENAPEKGEIQWNFEKFLVDKQGNVKARFSSGTKPESKELKQKIESFL